MVVRGDGPQSPRQAPRIPGRSTVIGRRHVVASTHHLATAAGHEVMLAGGNAIDGGVAAGIALNVVERQYSDLGGVAPIMVLRPGMSTPETWDGLGRWPHRTSLATHLAAHGHDLPVGLGRAVVPGAPDSWFSCLARHGRLTLAEVLEPAVRLTEGFAIHDSLARQILIDREKMSAWRSSAELYLPGGRPLARGDVLVQRDLGALLRHLIDVERGAAHLGREAAILAARDDFYRGAVGAAIAAFLGSEGAALTGDDLAAHRVTVEPSVSTTYRGIEVHATGPWSQGPLVPMVLNLLEGFDVGDTHGTALHYHRLAEAVKLAAADREGYFGDPTHVDVPIEGLLSKSYADERRRLIDDDRAAPGLPAPGDPWRHEGRQGRPGFRPTPRAGGTSPDTCYVSVIDDEGNAFSATPSDSGFDGPIVPGLGIVISTRGSQLWLESDHPSAIAPGKRPRLTPNPGMLVHGGRPLLAFGCPGADAQTQAMVQVVLNLVDADLDLQPSIEFARVVSMSFPDSFHPHAYEPGLLWVEGDIDERIRRDLAERGHRVEVIPPLSGRAAGVCAVLRGRTALFGGADPRRESSAIAL
jgi:gamma-glutamyltranspeptidase/glutathione hydrolase